MRIHYLEVVTDQVDAVCAAYAAANGVAFGEPAPDLGGARTAPLAAAVATGGQVAHPPAEIPGRGTFAVYIQGRIQQGLWRK